MYKLIDSQPQNTILNAVKEYRSVLGPTYGPAGQGVMIYDGRRSKLVDDGQMASQAIEIKSELHQAIIAFIKEAAEKTNARVGDGTTTAAILLCELITTVFETEKFAITTKKNFRSEIVELTKGLTEATTAIRKSAKKIKSKEDLVAIAKNSYNNEEIAKLIADLVFKTGAQGAITVEESQGVQTDSTLTQGLELDRGYASPYLAPTPTVKMKNPQVLLSTKAFDRFVDLATILKDEIETKKKVDFLIVAESFSDETIAGVVINNSRGTNIMLVQAPSFGDHKTNLLNDIAALTGATVLDPKKGEDFAFGTAETVLITKSATTLINGKDMAPYVKTLEPKEPLSAYEQERLDRRIASLLGGVGIIKVGANTESEMLTMKAKVEDAVHATQAAFRSGTVQGGGLTYSGIETSSKLLNTILKAPRKQLEDNGVEYLSKDAKDPAEVLIAALESAISIGIGLLNTGAIVAEKREDKENNPFG